MEWRRVVFVSSDDALRRLVYAIPDSPLFAHYSASAQVFEEGAGSRFVWIVDFLPNAMAGGLSGMMEAGVDAMRTTLNQGPVRGPNREAPADDRCPAQSKILE